MKTATFLLVLLTVPWLCGAAEAPAPRDAARIKELEATVTALTRENRELRALLVSIARTSAPPAVATSAPVVKEVGGDYWLSESGKRHVRGCRYFGTGKGRAATASEGNPCRICGG
jgi:hypothetical protein